MGKIVFPYPDFDIHHKLVCHPDAVWLRRFFVSSPVANACFVKEDDPAISLPRILVGASAMLRVEPLASESCFVVYLFAIKYHRDTFIWSGCVIQILRVDAKIR